MAYEPCRCAGDYCDKPFLHHIMQGYKMAADGNYVHESTGTIFTPGDSMVLNDESVNVLNAETVYEDIFDDDLIL